MIGLYRIRNIVNNKFYFGQTIDLDRREKDYFNYGQFPNDHFKNSFNKYGKKNFEFKVMFECPEELLDVCEELLIYLLDTQNPDKGYNKDSGGNSNKRRSDETKQKMSKRMSGENNPMFGKIGENHSKYGYVKKGGNTSGYYRVYKAKCFRCKQGFFWRYKYRVNGKQKVISSVDLKKLEEKVKAAGLEWRKV